MQSAPPRRIRPLSPLLANQIAAGEVVERPASVVKELVENSLDAGAERIEIEIEQSGLRLIRVMDDGCGIHPEDLLLSVSRHATSKVYDLDEMARVVSMGFRGEALASIASVSRFRLTSRSREAAAAWALSGEGGEFPPPLPAAHGPGTSIDVRDLFFNAPARRKFLRTERTEFAYLEDMVRRLALGRFEVGFVLRHNGRSILSSAGGEGEPHQVRRLAALCGQPFLDSARQVSFEAAGLRLHGWVGEMRYSRSQADLQYFFVNGRSIRDRLVTHALRQVYRDSLPPGRHPAYVLFLEIAPERVDVNVHPTKHEVRFREARLVHDFLFRALREVLGGAAVGPFNQPPMAPAVSQGGQLGEQAMEYGARAGADAAGSRGWECALALPGGYLLGQNESGMVLVDRRRAERFLLLRQLKASRSAEASRSRPLLIPVSVLLPEHEASQLERVREPLAGYGFEVDRIGERSLVVRRIPPALEGVEVAPVVREVLGLLAAGCDELEVLERLADHGAEARASRRASGEENASLLRSLFALRREPGADQAWVEVGEAEWQALFSRLGQEKTPG